MENRGKKVKNLYELERQKIMHIAVWEGGDSVSFSFVYPILHIKGIPGFSQL